MLVNCIIEAEQYKTNDITESQYLNKRCTGLLRITNLGNRIPLIFILIYFYFAPNIFSVLFPKYSLLQPVLIYNDLPLKFLIYNGGKKVIKLVKFINENFCMIFLKIFFIKGFICAHIRNYFRQSLLKELRFITHYIIFL